MTQQAYPQGATTESGSRSYQPMVTASSGVCIFPSGLTPSSISWSTWTSIAGMVSPVGLATGATSVSARDSAGGVSEADEQAVSAARGHQQHHESAQAVRHARGPCPRRRTPRSSEARRRRPVAVIGPAPSGAGQGT
jgi:hypothetical protein